MDILILLITGFGVGILSSFFGVGGGIIIVPTLYALFPNMQPVEVISISLLTIFLNTIINNYQFKKLQLSPSNRIFGIFVVFCAVGALSGSALTNILDPNILKYGFGIILLMVVIKNLLYKKKKIENDQDYKESSLKLSITALLGSALSALTGLGGGVIYVPLLQDLVKVPLKKISAYSNMAMMLSVMFALVPHAIHGNVDYKISFILFGGALVSSKLGIYLNDKVDDSTKKVLLSLILLTSSLKILFF
jgi:uncharacterized membrane protein YfcA